MDVVFVARFLSNRRFLNEVVPYQELFCVVTLPASSSNGEDGGNEKIQKFNGFNKYNKNCERAAGFFDQFLCRHPTINAVKLDRIATLRSYSL